MYKTLTSAEHSNADYEIGEFNNEPSLLSK